MSIKNLIPNHGDNVLLLAACEINDIRTLDGVYYLVSLINNKDNINIAKVKITNKYGGYKFKKRIKWNESDTDISFLFYEYYQENKHARLTTEIKFTEDGLIKVITEDVLTAVKDYYNNSSYIWADMWTKNKLISKTTLPLIKIDANAVMIKESLRTTFKNMDRKTKNLFMV